MNNRLTHAAGVVAEECVSGSLDLFTPPYMETMVENVYSTEYLPTNAISDTANSITFNIPAADDMIDLTESFVQVKCKITKHMGEEEEEWFFILARL